MTSSPKHGQAFWACAGFTLASALVSAGFSALALRDSARDVLAHYAAARSAALLLAVVWALAARSRGGVAGLALAMTAVQFLDALIGFRIHDPSKSYGPLAFALINAGLLLWMRSSERETAA